MKNKKQQGDEKRQKLLSGHQVVAAVLGVREDTVGKVVGGKTLYTSERTELYRGELSKAIENQQQYIRGRRTELKQRELID